MAIGAEVGERKAALRARCLRRRRARPAAERAAAAAAVADALVRGVAGARTLAAYVPDEIEPGAGRLPEALTQPARGCCCRSWRARR